MGTNTSERKRQRSESSSSDDEAESPCMKFRKESDAVSPEFAWWYKWGCTHSNDNHKGADDRDEILKELTAIFQDEDRKEPVISEHLAEVANKSWG